MTFVEGYFGFKYTTTQLIPMNGCNYSNNDYN